MLPAFCAVVCSQTHSRGGGGGGGGRRSGQTLKVPVFAARARPMRQRHAVVATFVTLSVRLSGSWTSCNVRVLPTATKIAIFHQYLAFQSMTRASSVVSISTAECCQRGIAKAGAGGTGRHLPGTANGRKIVKKIHMQMQIVSVPACIKKTKKNIYR